MSLSKTSFKKGNKTARNKRSRRARKTAEEILDSARKEVKGESLYQTILRMGYSKWTARKPKQVLSTLSFQDEVKANGVLDTMKESQALAAALLSSRLRGDKHQGPLLTSTSELVTISKTLIHGIQLLSGAETDRIGTDVKGLKNVGDLLRELREKI